MPYTDEELAKASSLSNPDDAQQSTYKHDFKISQKILGMLISDRHFLVQSMDLIKPEYFEDDGHRLICNIVFDFFKAYKDLPSKVEIQNEIKEKRGNSDHLYQYLGELEAIIVGHVPASNTREYLMDKIVEFAKEQAARCAVARTMDVLKKKPQGGWNKIWELWREALTTDKGHDIGLEYLPTLEERYDRMLKKETKEIFSSGFPGIDNMLSSGGMTRGEIGAFVGLSGSGKSIALINAAQRNLMMDKRVCYITLELSEDKVAQRFDSLLTDIEYRALKEHKDHVIKTIRHQFRHCEDQRRLTIKHYPGGTADVNTIRAYLSQLSLYQFKPDLLIVDYVGELKDIPGIKTYESRQLLVRELRTLAQEEQMCALTAFQANRKGREIQDIEGSIDDDALADSFGQMRPMDCVWSINKLEGSNLGHIYAMKHRDGRSKEQIWYELNVNTLKMNELTREDFRIKSADFRKKKANEASEKIQQIEVNNGQN
jgi:replicative DNA helicase